MTLATTEQDISCEQIPEHFFKQMINLNRHVLHDKSKEFFYRFLNQTHTKAAKWFLYQSEVKQELACMYDYIWLEVNVQMKSLAVFEDLAFTTHPCLATSLGTQILDQEYLV